MKVILTPQDLEKIRSAGISEFKERQHSAIESNLQATWCTINAFAAHLKARGFEFDVELPERQVYESVDD